MKIRRMTMKVIDVLKQNLPIVKTEAQSQLSKAEAIDQLKILQQLLINDDFNSVQFMNERQADFSFHFPEQFKAIQKATNNYEMDEADELRFNRFIDAYEARKKRRESSLKKNRR